MARTPRRHPASQLSRAVRDFLHTEASGGIVLLVSALVAMVWANSPWHGGYEQLWHTELRLSLGAWSLEDDLQHWVNDALMAIFFFVVGLEVKRELVTGELRRWRTAALPTIAAIGGMVVPALVYLAFNAGRAGSGGWGIPMATDIAFALGVLAVLGPRVHPALKVFLLTLAVADDIGAILVIAVVYTSSLDAEWLAFAAGALAVILLMQRAGVGSLGPYILAGVLVWLGFFNSGVHATIAGVILGLITPARPAEPDQVVRTWARELVEEPTPGDLRELRRIAKRGESPVERLERALHPWSSFLIIPVFALANAGVRVSDADLGGAGAAAVALGVGAGLVAGKLAGILAFAWLAIRFRVGEMPYGLRWSQLAGGAACAGIGFTVSLFVAGLAFDDPALTDAAKVGILAGSGIAAALGAAILLRSPAATDDEPEPVLAVQTG